MSKYLIVFEEAGGPETYLEATMDKVVERVKIIQDQCIETDEAMEESVTIYEVARQFRYRAPVTHPSLIETIKY